MLMWSSKPQIWIFRFVSVVRQRSVAKCVPHVHARCISRFYFGRQRNIQKCVPHAGLKVYFWLWEHLCYQVHISRRTAKILGAQRKTLVAQLKILGTPVPTEKQNLRHYYVIFTFLYFFQSRVCCFN